MENAHFVCVGLVERTCRMVHCSLLHLTLPHFFHNHANGSYTSGKRERMDRAPISNSYRLQLFFAEQWSLYEGLYT